LPYGYEIGHGFELVEQPVVGRVELVHFWIVEAEYTHTRLVEVRRQHAQGGSTHCARMRQFSSHRAGATRRELRVWPDVIHLNRFECVPARLHGSAQSEKRETAACSIRAHTHAHVHAHVSIYPSLSIYSSIYVFCTYTCT